MKNFLKILILALIASVNLQAQQVVKTIVSYKGDTIVSSEALPSLQYYEIAPLWELMEVKKGKLFLYGHKVAKLGQGADQFVVINGSDTLHTTIEWVNNYIAWPYGRLEGVVVSQTIDVHQYDAAKAMDRRFAYYTDERLLLADSTVYNGKLDVNIQADAIRLRLWGSQLKGQKTFDGYFHPDGQEFTVHYGEKVVTYTIKWTEEKGIPNVDDVPVTAILYTEDKR